MKEITIVLNKAMDHQIRWGASLAEGLRKHGYKVYPYDVVIGVTTHLAACWGWRLGQQLRKIGKEVLVMERGYIGDRTEWTSLGFNGLNGHATWPEMPLGGATRFNELFSDSLCPLRLFEQRGYILVIGQVPGDMSLQGEDLRGWYRRRTVELWDTYSRPIMFRPHPLDKSSLDNQWAGFQHVHALNVGPLDVALQGAAGVVCWNSNTAIDSLLAGLPTETNNEGSMVYDLTQAQLHFQNKHPTAVVERLHALQAVAWRQWSSDELVEGLPWSIHGTPHNIRGI